MRCSIEPRERRYARERRLLQKEQFKKQLKQLEI